VLGVEGDADATDDEGGLTVLAADEHSVFLPDVPEPDTFEPSAEEQIDPKVRGIWIAKLAAAQEAGQHARHCHGSTCKNAGPRCGCWCEGCRLVAKLYGAALREALRD
jgi:hypothetical protein